MGAIFRHVGVDLILADDNEARAVLDHGLQDIRTAREHMSDDVVSSLERLVGHFSRRDHGHSLHVDVLPVELRRKSAVRERPARLDGPPESRPGLRGFRGA